MVKDKQKKSIHSRTKYMDHSRRFLEWVNTLGLEQTVFGRLVHYLDARFQIRRLSFLFLFTLLLSFLLFWDIDFPYFVQVGDIATTDIKSPISFQIVDEVATETKRREAEQSVPPIYDFDPNAYENTTHNIYKSWRKMRQLVKQTAWPNEDHRRAEAVSEFMEQKKTFETELGSPVTDLIFRWLIDKRFSASLENILIEAFAKWSSYKVYDGATNLLPEDDAPLIVRVIDRRGAFEEYTAVRGELKSLRDPRNFSFEGVPGEAGLAQHDRKQLQALALEILAPNLTFNRQETSDRKDKARASVLPVQLSIAKNQVVVAAGAIVQPIHVTLMEEIRNLKSDRRSDFVSLVSALLFLSLMLVFFSYTRRFTLNRVRVQDKELAVMGLVTVIVVLITKIFLFMTDAAFVVKYGNLVPSSAFLYSAPIAAGPMLVGLLISSGEIIWLFTAFLAIVGAVMVDFNFGFLLVSMIGGIAAARGVYSCKKRNDIYWAGVRTGLVNSLVIALVLVMQGMGNTELLNQLIWAVPAGFMGGIISSMIAMMLVPLLESAFNFVTDVKLLELSNLNHPLMQEMIVKAPGTYHHSLVVGSMVEAAASEIGANALLAKVMAFYHDIGKTSHAQYFIENQKPGNNPHDHISPYMSKTILIAHIKDGAEMGMRHQLGKPIIDGVLQHHGTTLISYFYNKALDEADQDVDQVLEDDFRYPGPKPQFREAALVMLADSIEAAARSLDEPTTARLQNIVKNIIQAKFLDGQLNECNLTLADLSVIESSFCRILLGIYHQRIDYPNLNMSQSNPFKLRDSKPRGEKKGMSGA